MTNTHNDLPDPYIIGDSMIFTLDQALLQVGAISVKDLSIHDIPIPEIIIFRPNDYLTMEFNFIHLFFVHRKKLTVYASKDQILSLKKMMQIALFAGETGWARSRLISSMKNLSTADRLLMRSLLDDYNRGTRTALEISAKIPFILTSYPPEILDNYRIYLNQELALKAFPIFSNEKIIMTVDDFCPEFLNFIEYREGEDISINAFVLNVVRNQVSIYRNDQLLQRQEREVRHATDLIYSKFPYQLIVDLAVKHRHKLVADGIAQIGSGDGMAYTPNQDTSCTLIRQAEKTYLLDASIQSIIKSAYLGVNVYDDDVIALLTHGCHGDHGAGLYYLARLRKMQGKTLKILCHPIVLENYIEKCTYIYQNEFPGLKFSLIRENIKSLFTPIKDAQVIVTPFNTHPVPTTGFYFTRINFYVTGDMSGAELLPDRLMEVKQIDVSEYYLKEDILILDTIIEKVVETGFVAMECGSPPIHISKDLIYKFFGGEQAFLSRVDAKKLFLYHTSGQRDANDWVVVSSYITE